jgi:biotin/methionine sulfoxide reductase
MHKILQPFGQARDEFDIFSDLAARLGAQNAYTEGRSAREWLAHIYGQTRAALDERGLSAPDFDEFWAKGELDLPLSNDPGPIEKYRIDPVRHPLATPTGRIEIFSETIAGYGQGDSPGHASWLEPEEWLAGSISQTCPFQLISNQPSTRLHSQLDFGETSLSSKIQGREPLLINPQDAERHGIADGSIVRVFNARGSFLAGARVSAGIRPQVVQIATGAWYDPQEIKGFGLVCVHGNPNAVTRDTGTSSLAQGCTGQLTMVDIEPFHGELPKLECHKPPEVERAATDR